MRRTILACLVMIMPAAYGQKPEPNQFPETVKVVSETKETDDKGDTFSTRKPQATIFSPNPKTRTVVTHHVKNYFQCKVLVGDTLYTVNGRNNAPGAPLGVFKGRIRATPANQYMDIYIVDQNGPYVLTFEIVGAEKVEKPG